MKKSDKDFKLMVRAIERLSLMCSTNLTEDEIDTKFDLEDMREQLAKAAARFGGNRSLDNVIQNIDDILSWYKEKEK